MLQLVIECALARISLDGPKVGEIRGSRTHVRGTIGLVASGSGAVVGVCELDECHGPLTAREFRGNAPRKVGIRPEKAELGYYAKTYAWEVSAARRFRKPIPYVHRPGAVIWVTLDEGVEKRIRRDQAFKQRRD